MAVALGSAASSSCRAATEPFDPEEEALNSTELPRRLTFSSGDDRAPSWSSGGDTIYYSATGALPIAEGRGVLQALPAAGGRATALLPTVQFPGGAPRWLSAPSVSPGGDRLAYAELWSVRDAELCSPVVGVQCSPTGVDPAAPRLAEVFIRVRSLSQPAANIDLEPRVSMRLEGLILEPTGTFRVRFHPFHQEFQVGGTPVFRPSWSPDGSRLVFSDGLRLLVWQVGVDAPTEIAGTDDGVSPVWSPDGQWIAYTRLVRGDSIVAACDHFAVIGVACSQLRTVFPVARRVVSIVRPDGTDRRDLWDGVEPTWTPDGARIVFASPGGGLRVGAPDGAGAPAAVAGAEGGREPVVSPDGSTLVFTVRGESGSRDVWLVGLGG